MSKIILEQATLQIRDWINTNKPVSLPGTIPILIANRDEMRTRPCIVIEGRDPQIRQPLKHTARMSLTVHLFTQIDDTTLDNHNAWAEDIASLLHDRAAMKTAMNSDTFILHDLIPQTSEAGPDESRGRQTSLIYEAVVSALG